MQESVLVVEDEQDVANLLRFSLSKAGFLVLIATNGINALEIAVDKRPDIVVLDLMLPELDGEKVCGELKQNRETAAIPVLILSAKSRIDDRVQGFEIGADDYLTKPFSPRELVLRVQALLRRTRVPERSGQIEVDDFAIDKDGFEVRLEGRRLILTATEYKLLRILIERRGRTQSRDILLFDVWGYRNSIDTRTVDTHMRRLREKLGRHSDRLETVRGEGYRFSAVKKPDAQH